MDFSSESASQAATKSPESSCITGSELQLIAKSPGGKLLLQSRANHHNISQALQPLLGCELPQPGRVAVGSELTVLGLAPTKWMVLVKPERLSDTAKELQAAANHLTCLIADQSDARSEFEVSGAQAVNLLSKVCALDLHPDAFSVGCCAQSQLARVPLLLFRTDSTPALEPAFRLFVDRSLAAYAWDWLSDAAAEFCTPSAA